MSASLLTGTVDGTVGVTTSTMILVLAASCDGCCTSDSSVDLLGPGVIKLIGVEPVATALSVSMVNGIVLFVSTEGVGVSRSSSDLDAVSLEAASTTEGVCGVCGVSANATGVIDGSTTEGGDDS